MITLNGTHTSHPHAKPANPGPVGLAPNGAVRTLPAKQSIYMETDPAEDVFEVVSGTIKLYKLTPDGRRQITSFVYPGQMFGLADLGEYLHTAETVTPCTIRAYNRARVTAAMDSDNDVAQRIAAAALADLAAAQEHLLLLGRKTATERLASFLVDLSARATQPGDTPKSVSIPMSRLDIADYLGLTIETVSRTFGRLRAWQIIALDGANAVHILDRRRLVDLATADE